MQNNLQAEIATCDFGLASYLIVEKRGVRIE